MTRELSDAELANALIIADRRKVPEDIAEAENAICARLDLPLDWTEQGLNPQAAGLICIFVAKHGSSGTAPYRKIAERLLTPAD